MDPRLALTLFTVGVNKSRNRMAASMTLLAMLFHLSFHPDSLCQDHLAMVFLVALQATCFKEFFVIMKINSEKADTP